MPGSSDVNNQEDVLSVCSVTGNANEDTIYDYLNGTLGIGCAGCCGALGNLYIESGFSPLAYNSGENAWGICQWEGSRLTDLQSMYPDLWKTLSGQLSYLKYELNGGDYQGSSTLSYLKNVADTTDGAKDGALYFAKYFERCASASFTKRQNWAATIHDGRHKSDYDPVISDIQISQIDSTGYTISCKVTDDVEVSQVQFPTWVGNETALWKEGTKEGDVWTFRVNDSDHRYAKGIYETHIYAYDSAGNVTWADGGKHKVKNTATIVAEITFNNHRYLLYDDYLPWQDAKAFCEDRGGHLVTITSQVEQNAIESLIQKGTRSVYCIGLTDAKEEGDFEWLTGEEYVYSNWLDGEPNDSGGIEDVVFLYNLTAYFGLWNDYDGGTYTYRGIGLIMEIEEDQPVVGDLNQDGKLSIIDARLAKRIAMKDSQVEYTTINVDAGDLDGNGKITINEARKIKRAVLGGITLQHH